MTPDEIDESFVARPLPDIEEVTIGDEVVLLEGWAKASALSATGALIWSRFDGESSLESISERLSDLTGTDLDRVRPDVVQFARRAAAQGLLVDAGPAPSGRPVVHLDPIADLAVGEPVADTAFIDLEGQNRALADFSGREALIVNWSPHCGHCWTIAEHLAVLTGPLDEAGVQLVLITTATAEANRSAADEVGLRAPILIRDFDIDPFIGYGTPCAYHVDPRGRLVAPMARGSQQVAALATELAGVDPVTLFTDEGSDPVPAGTRYLLADDGVCGASTGTEPSVAWTGTATYRIDGFHVGLRHGDRATEATMEALFRRSRVRDRRAGYSYSVSLGGGPQDPTPSASGGFARSLGLLVKGDRPLVRSRSAARILRALLWRLDDEMLGFETPPGRIRVRATAARVGDQAVLLQPGLHMLGDAIQPRLARLGVALADMAYPELDLATAELIVGEPRISHDPAVIASLDRPIESSSELAPVGPGRYPLVGWGVVAFSDRPVTELSPAEAAAATLSFMYEAEDAPTRLRELGELFRNIRGFGLSYHSEDQLVAAIDQALHVSTDP